MSFSRSLALQVHEKTILFPLLAAVLGARRCPRRLLGPVTWLSLVAVYRSACYRLIPSPPCS